MVGTRRPTAAGEQYARHLAGVLAKAGVAIASGGAEGIDTAAHLGALDVGGSTVVVAPSGFRRPYPEANAELFRQIVNAGGGFLSLVPADEPAIVSRFFCRNRILAALAHAVVLVESPWRSGARNATKHARNLGRAVFVVAHPPWNSRGRGWLTELALGARALGAPKEVLRYLAEQRLHPLPVGGGPPSPPPDEPPAAGRRAESASAHPAEIAGRTPIFGAGRK